jgi:biofilm PGA synthesis N-glycosyltransferase PgaC
VDACYPFLDAAFSLALPAGLVLAATGRFWIIGPLTLLVLPLNALLGGVMVAREWRALSDVGLRVRHAGADLLGSGRLRARPSAPHVARGALRYVAEIVRRRRVW